MKRLSALILAVIILICMTACTEINLPKDERIQIVATIFPQYDFARAIAKNNAQVNMLIPPGAESHSFEPTTSDILELSTCDIFIYTGGESDSWIDDILKNIDNPDMTIISLADCIPELISTDEHGHSDSDAHNHSKTDEHVWTSPVNAIKICETICNALCEKDRKNADSYKENLKTYLDELSVLDKEFRTVTENSERDTLVFGDRFPLIYFAKEYGLEYMAAFSGCSDDTEASASTIANLIEKVKEENIPVVLKIELSSDSIASTIAKETGAEVLTFYSCHNISKEDFEKGETYLSLMKKNVHTLELALN